MDSPEELYESGIYVNDLSMHDSSRDIILAGSQKDPELKLALSQVSTRQPSLLEAWSQHLVTCMQHVGEDSECSVGGEYSTDRQTPVPDDPQAHS